MGSYYAPKPQGIFTATILLSLLLQLLSFMTNKPTDTGMMTV